ncbi:Pentapeptide repeat [uncultured Caudovirales phage]|uniref:Pentapeptide repeat n=1 Tax=uncultured Caudovirales phage TaxID=2100421 RepID=A0A6J5LEY4_9CAUD|nr:Pentapeptide repeat [uncultured Caudovirales phage]
MIVKNKLTNETILEIESLRRADLRNANLYNAYLSNTYLKNADLRNADLRNADLRNADLYNADLSGADLSNADLSGADLSNADLRNADLRYANLTLADFRRAIGNMKEIKTILIEKWIITFTHDEMAIGCQQHTIEEWENFNDDDIEKMHSDALKFWKKWKDFIFLAIEKSTKN